MTSNPTSPPPYQSGEDYISLVPQYTFGGVNDTGLIGRQLAAMLPSGRDIVVADCGAGPGRYWSCLPPQVSQIVGVEPNLRMWRASLPHNATYVQMDGLGFMRSRQTRADVIMWLWSLNYALLQYFEHYDADARRVVVRDWTTADDEARDALSSALNARSEVPLLVWFFDDSSPEQQFVTDTWTAEAPFPFNDRAHTRSIFLDCAVRHAEIAGRRLHHEHLRGTADYGTPAEATRRMLRFHLRGHFDEQPAVVHAVRGFLNRHNSDGRILIPAGVHVYRLV